MIAKHSTVPSYGASERANSEEPALGGEARVGTGSSNTVLSWLCVHLSFSREYSIGESDKQVIVKYEPALHSLLHPYSSAVGLPHTHHTASHKVNVFLSLSK